MPDNTDIEVAAAETPPDDVPFPEDEFIGDDALPPDDPPVDDPPPPAAITHPPELIERAAVLQIPADEVAAMSSDELRRVIKHADRVGQMVYDMSAKKPDAPPAPATPPPAPTDELAALDDPEKYDQGFVAPIKAVLVKQAQENKELRERLAKLESKTGRSESQLLHTRLMGVAAEVAPELAKAFDTATQAGNAKYSELLTIMGALQTTNKSLTEKQLLQRAVKAMELVPEKPAEAPETAASKKRWDDAALGAPLTRKTKETDVERVNRVLQQYRKPKPVNGEAARK